MIKAASELHTHNYSSFLSVYLYFVLLSLLFLAYMSWCQMYETLWCYLFCMNVRSYKDCIEVFSCTCRTSGFPLKVFGKRMLKKAYSDTYIFKRDITVFYVTIIIIIITMTSNNSRKQYMIYPVGAIFELHKS